MVPSMPSGITVKISGGLGNQLFQYAAARSLALEKNADLILDASFYDSGRHRSFDLERFSIQPKAVTRGAGPRWISHLKALGTRLLRLDHPQYHEPHHHFDQDVFDLQPPCGLHGYFQSVLYFQRHASTIHRELQPPAAADVESLALSGMMGQSEAVSLHVRRGDYVTNARARQIFCECGPEYYERALDLIPESGPVLVFSDDPAWCRQRLPRKRELIFVGEQGSRDGVADLWLMTQASHHIIANSTFSWWGAWLSGNRKGLKIAPERWFCERNERARDLVPQEWIRV